MSMQLVDKSKVINCNCIMVYAEDVEVDYDVVDY